MTVPPDAKPSGEWNGIVERRAKRPFLLFFEWFTQILSLVATGGVLIIMLIILQGRHDDAINRVKAGQQRCTSLQHQINVVVEAKGPEPSELRNDLRACVVQLNTYRDQVHLKALPVPPTGKGQ